MRFAPPCQAFLTCLSSQDGNSPLIEAAWAGNTEVVVELIKAGVNLNLQNEVQRLSILCTSHSMVHRDFSGLSPIFTFNFKLILIIMMSLEKTLVYNNWLICDLRYS